MSGSKISGQGACLVDSVADSAIDSLNAAQSKLEKEQISSERKIQTGQTGAIVLHGDG